ncbi:prostaglandin E synthase 2-like [Senna tora]|uniref:Prostaglandin E synthase 2 n=1 Tax=Senna tora TaxID=362788 RepID=A0A834TYD2_9FABA|nr:prostaglandin E synthase 2-like [Senna tora]
MMRGVNRVVFLGRAIRSDFATVSGISSGATHQQLPQFTLYGTCSNPSSHWLSQKAVDHLRFSSPSIAHSVAGIVRYSSASATSVAHDDHAKETLRAEGVLPKDVVLYQYEACPFCNKVKAFLDFYDIPYKIVEVNPINKKEIKWSDYKKVPIVTVDGEQMVDSSDIIDKLLKRMHPDYDLNADEEKRWRGWVDNHLVHVLSPNIYRTVPEALESFDYITTRGNFSFFERLTAKYSGAAIMYLVSKKLKKKHNITDERAALYGAAEQWVDALKGRKFLGESNPNLADLAVFGVLRPIRHLKSGRDMVEHTRIGRWYSEMEQAVGQCSSIDA